MVNKKGLLEDHYIPSEREEGEFFVGGRGKVLEGDPSKFTPDIPKKHVLKLRRRHEWGSPPPFQEDEGILAKHPIQNVLFSFTETDDTFYEVDCKYKLFLLRDEYMEKGMYELPWNFVVGGDGTVFEARGWDRLPENNPELPEFDGNFIDIAHFGRRGNLAPTEVQISASWELVMEGVKNKYLVPLPTRRSLFYRPSYSIKKK